MTVGRSIFRRVSKRKVYYYFYRMSLQSPGRFRPARPAAQWQIRNYAELPGYHYGIHLLLVLPGCWNIDVAALNCFAGSVQSEKNPSVLELGALACWIQSAFRRVATQRSWHVCRSAT